MPILADYSADFQPLSDQHVVLLRRASEILDAYRSGALIDLTYAAIGTFGAGKTQFLYWLHRKSLDQGLVPILILAEDLFAEIIRKDRTFTQGDVAALVHDKVSRFLGVLRSGRPKTEVVEELRALTDPRSNLGSLLEAVVNRFSGIVPESARPVLLVDELDL
jgi:hypothetical protein